METIIDKLFKIEDIHSWNNWSLEEKKIIRYIFYNI